MEVNQNSTRWENNQDAMNHHYNYTNRFKIGCRRFLVSDIYIFFAVLPLEDDSNLIAICTLCSAGLWSRRLEILTFWVQSSDFLSYYLYAPKLSTVWLSGGRCFALLWRALRISVHHTFSGSWAVFWPNTGTQIWIHPEFCCLYQGKTDMNTDSEPFDVRIENHIYLSRSLWN